MKFSVRDARLLGFQCRQASVEDAESLDQARHEARAVINRAGPFLDTADAVVAAALRAHIHYLDVTAEQAGAAPAHEVRTGWLTNSADLQGIFDV